MTSALDLDLMVAGGLIITLAIADRSCVDQTWYRLLVLALVIRIALREWKWNEGQKTTVVGAVEQQDSPPEETTVAPPPAGHTKALPIIGGQQAHDFYADLAAERPPLSAAPSRNYAFAPVTF